jgi:hypothetical protein
MAIERQQQQQQRERRRHASVDMTGWLQTPRSGSFRMGRSSSTRVQSFGRDVVIPALKRQGSAIASTTKSLYKESLTSYRSCFGPWRRTSTTSAESPISSLLKHTDGAATEASTGPGSLADSLAPNTGSAALDEARQYGAAFSGQLRSRHRPKSRSMSFVQSNSVAAWGTSEWDVKEPRRDPAPGQWPGTSEIENELFKPAPMWKQLLKKLRAQAKQHVHPVPAREWTNYDVQSYAMNFDNGSWRDSNFSSLYFDEDEELQRMKLALRETALHTALLQKFHSTRYDSSAVAAALVRADSVPVNPIRPYHPKKDFVPLWQRRHVQPPSKLELTRSI